MAKTIIIFGTKCVQVPELAKMLSVSEQRARKLLGDGRIPGAIKVEGWLIPEAAGKKAAKKERPSGGAGSNALSQQ